MDTPRQLARWADGVVALWKELNVALNQQSPAAADFAQAIDFINADDERLY